MDKLWLNHYQAGIPFDIDSSQDESLVTLFTNACQKYAHKKAYTNYGTSISYQKLYELSLQFAAYLQSLGIQKGDRIAIMLPNTLQYPVVIFGTLLIGAIVVNTNPLYTADEISYQLNDSGAKAIVILANFAHTLEQALPKIHHLEHIIVTELGDLFPPIKRWMANALVKYVKRMIPKFHFEKMIAFKEIINPRFRESDEKINQDATATRIAIDPNDIAFIQYTGGTTGISKGAMLTHRNLLSNVLQASAWVTPLNINSEDIIVTALPLYHIFSLTANCLTFLYHGAENILITNPRDLDDFIRQIRRQKITAVTGVNTLFNALLHHRNFNKIDFRALKLSLSGGMTLQKNIAENWQKRTHSRILEAYGLTETSPAVTINPLYLDGYNGSIGLPLPSTDISIRNDSGQEVLLGEAGELCVKGPQVMPGYWHRPEETALVFWPDGFLRTGDIGKMDEQGFIYLVDRKKDMILISGFNVYPNEVEQVIGMMPGVLEVGVVGVKDQFANEKVKACIVKEDPNLTEADVIAHCRKHLAAYKVPKIVEFYTELPKSNVGKILRRELK